MSKIISIIIKFLNRINKIIWKICIFLSSLIPVEEIDKLNDKPSNERYRHFKVDEQPIIEPFVTIEHKDHKQLIKDNNIKPVKYRNGKEITIKWLKNYSGEFVLRYGVAEKTVVGESLF